MEMLSNECGPATVVMPGWYRFPLAENILYIQPEIPDWIVLSSAADRLLRAPKTTLDDRYARDLLESAFAVEPVQSYAGRADSLSLGPLKECWFHVTDICNLSCRHCLFGASPAKGRTLAPELLQGALHQALALGCRLFSFTGGEPFLYPEFLRLLGRLLGENRDVHVAVLTNGMLVDRDLDALSALERIHLQVSLDGLEGCHDRLRGRGSYQKVVQNLKALGDLGIPVTISVALSAENIEDLLPLVEVAAGLGVASIHLLYHFVRGKGSVEQFIGPDIIWPALVAAWRRATELGLSIDNIEIMRSQVFATPGTRHDLSNAAWESLAVGPDGRVYPSPALVGKRECRCGHLDSGLKKVWQTSPVLEELRRASLIHAPVYADNPLKFLVGGGDVDHSFLSGQQWVGHDPYVGLYNRLALQLIEDQVGQYRHLGKGGILLRMGDVRHDCPSGDGEGGEVALTHCNCLISLASDTGHSSVREFYAEAALIANKDISNPLAPAQDLANFVPEKSKEHSYGCGSPVTDAAPHPGETLVDLGSGAGIECFMASASVGREGRVYGIDMTDEMLALAYEGQAEVSKGLGYSNVEFRKGLLEAIPLDDALADVVISNCVINLSPDKRKTYQEIYRVLKPGGRVVVSDIVTDGAIPVGLKNNIRYRGECLGGAMQQEALLAMMEGAGLGSIRLLKRFPYRQVGGVEFFSLTYEAIRPFLPPKELTPKEVIYTGPLGAVYTETGILLVRGRRTPVPEADLAPLGDSVFVLGGKGEVTNIAFDNPCCGPETAITTTGKKGCCDCGDVGSAGPVEDPLKKRTGCMVCAADLRYFTAPQEMSCSYCGRLFTANGCCDQGHYVCDCCHEEDGLEVILAICSGTRERDLITLLEGIRSHPSIPMHGPEHHAMIPGIIVACYRNAGGDIDEATLRSGIKRGAAVPGGVCGFWGACGAAVGAGIAVATILGVTPLTPAPRQTAQAFSAKIIARISQYRGGRCCQRETWLALQETARLSSEVLGIPLEAEGKLRCAQYLKNKECIRRQCPLWEYRAKNVESELQFLSLL